MMAIGREPIPARSPAPIAENIIIISFAVPGAERKRTRLKAPITAIPAPMFPFTTIIITQTIAGRSAIVRTKLFVYLFFTVYPNAIISPAIRAQTIQSKKLERSLRFSVSNDLRSLSKACIFFLLNIKCGMI